MTEHGFPSFFRDGRSRGAAGVPGMAGPVSKRHVPRARPADLSYIGTRRDLPAASTKAPDAQDRITTGSKEEAMPRPGSGDGPGPSSSSHDDGLRASSHGPRGAGRRPGMDSGGGFGDFGGFGGFGGPPPRRYHDSHPRYRSGIDLGDLINFGIGVAYGRDQERRSRQHAHIEVPHMSEDSMHTTQQPTGAAYGGPFGGGASGGGSGPFPTGGNGGGRNPKSGPSWLTAVAVAIAIACVVLLGFLGCSSRTNDANSSGGSIPTSTYNREKIDSGIAYDADDVDDELGWITDVRATGRGLKSFYDKTGIQPYVLLAKYNPDLTTDEQRETWARDWYKQHIDNQDTLLLVYFADKDSENVVGHSVLINGRNVSTVMDAQAVDIFWAYYDQYWYSNMSTDDAIVRTFDSTADRIMTKTTTTNDVLRWVIIAVIVIGVLVIIGIIVWMVIRRRREHEAYVERMVNTPLEEAEDPILKKYSQDDQKGQR